jgi:bifunctional non-homologous end joining protein LigD
MLRFDFCIPTTGKKVPAAPEWFHEIKYDGYRLRVQRDGESVRLITRGGYDWSKRYPWIVDAALKNRQKHFVIEGETEARTAGLRLEQGAGRDDGLPMISSVSFQL